MSCAVPDEIGEALGMPGADLEAVCERIRTLRQTEKSAEFLIFKGKAPARKSCGTGFSVGGLGDTWSAALMMREPGGDAA